MSDLTDKIRAKYPDDYKDMSDDDLERSVLAKHPEYKDLANSAKLVNDNASQTDNSGKSSNDSALKASQTPLASPSEDAKSRGNTESISASKSLSKGNLEANGAKAQDNIIDSDEHDSLLSKGWKLLSDPLTNLSSKTTKFISDTINPNSETKGIRGIGSAFIEGLGHVGDEMTSPLNAGLMALTGGESLASKMGAEDIIPALRTGSKILSAPIIAHGASNIVGDNKSLGDRAMGLVEMGMGSMPFFHGSEPAVATDLLKSSSKELPDINDALDNRPDLVPVDNNAEKSFNDGRKDIPVNEEDRLLDLVKDKQNMGKELPIDDLTNKTFADLYGKPIYHGTQKDIQTFDPNRKSEGLFNGMNHFTEDPVYADLYARGYHAGGPNTQGRLIPSSGELTSKILGYAKPNIIPGIPDAKNVLDLTQPLSEKDMNIIANNIPSDKAQLLKDAWSGKDVNFDLDDVIEAIDDPKIISKLPYDAYKYKAHGVNNWALPNGTEIKTPSGVPLTQKQKLIDLTNDDNSLTPPSDFKAPQFNPHNQSGLTGNLQSKPRLLLNSDGSFINKETGEMYDMRGHQISELDTSRPVSLIDSTDKMNNQEITHEGGSNEPPSYDPLDPHADEPNDPNNESRKTSLSDIINFPKALKASWDLSAPGRQGLGLIHTKPWWTAWNDMFQGVKSEDAFNATQKAIENRPLFKSYGDQPSFAQKAGLKLTNLGKLSDREESFMSSLAEKFPGVKTSERAYTAYLNKLRADSFENLLSKYKVLGEDGEYNIPLAKDLANYVNNATGRGDLGSLESSAVALNNAFFSPRFMVSRLKILGESAKAPFTPSTYMFSQPSVRREYLKSLLAIAGVGITIGELAKMSGGAEVEHDPTNSDFMKIKVGNTRIDPYAGMQQPIVLASRLLSGKETSSVSGKTTDLDNPKYGQSNRMDVIGRFARSKESPALSFAHGLLSGKDNAGNKFNVPEETVQLFVPMVLQDLKQVATENPNLIPYYHENGLGFENTSIPRGMLALPGFVGGSVQNYGAKPSN